MLKAEDNTRQGTMTPVDMRMARFGSAVRGFAKAEVMAFLEEAASDYESALRENERLRQQLAGLEASTAQYRELEGSLKTTLLSAQKVADDIRQTAQQEAARIVRESQTQVEDAMRELDGLKLKRREIQTSIEAFVTALQGTVAAVREQEHRERDARVFAHRPRSIEAAG